ncbi:UNVERIFIED_CONTAM: hypothetical protein Sradi_7079900 [Sesamum radiatum]|uniref:Retrotransposon gag domain-containing protein n=1 Tax=Sesamum radiatum TaxID=300843 RepID=A0AAW2J4N7_SESRA
MENPNQTTDKQKGTVPPNGTQALQVITGAPPLPSVTGSTPTALPPTPLPPRVTDPVADLPRRSTSSDASTEELSLALLKAIQQVVAAALQEHVHIAAPPRTAPPPEADTAGEEDEGEIPIPVLPAARRRNVPLPEPHEVPPQWLARLEHLQKGLQDVKYQIEGTPEDERQGVPFIETVMADELPLNCRTPAITEYNGTADPMEHLSRFEDAALLHRYTDGIKCRVFVTTFAGAAQQWFNQLPVGVIGSFQEFRSLFLHQFASSRKVRKTELSLFAIRQGEDEPLKEYLQRGEKRKEIREEAPSKKLRGDLRDKKPPFQRVNVVYTPLTVPITQALMAVEEKGLIARPRSWRDTPQRPKSDKFCRFHNDYGHTTEECRHLKNEIERLIQNGYLQEYVCWERARGTGPYQKKEGDRARDVRAPSPGRPSREGAKQTPGSKEDNNDIPRKGIIRMIAGGLSGGDSHQARKSQVREAHQISIKEALDIETVEDAPIIQFRRAERSGPQTIHNDALVITVMIANYEVGRIFIDSGSSADILFGEAYDQMQLGDVSLEVNTSLYGFAGEVVHP